MDGGTGFNDAGPGRPAVPRSPPRAETPRRTTVRATHGRSGSTVERPRPAREWGSASSLSPSLPLATRDDARRFLNVLVAALLLVLTLPLWLVIAAAIKLTSHGPVFYQQARIGLDRRWAGTPTGGRRRVDLGGRPFMMYKFRTMHVDAERSTGAVWAVHRDPRATPAGGFLRHYRLDELPQLINVLRGDMNLVGPRPERPGIFMQLRKTIPNYAMRQRVLPGITGHAQVHLEYDSCVGDVSAKLQYDLAYIARCSVGLDLAIMLRTGPVMLLRHRFLRCPTAAPAAANDASASGSRA
jgi:lipopolysaccharide/colanic/teichoic acid biosynthesis glycosyltransferase